MIRTRSSDLSIDSFVSQFCSERPIRWNELFENDNSLDVEIGCGLGEFLVRTASREPDRNFIGIETDWQRVKKTLKKITSLKQTSENNQGKNIRIMQVDALVAFERLFLPLTIHKIYSLFPCPWPKKSHIKHRLFSTSMFKLMNSRLREKGEIKIVTDHRAYFEWMEEQAHDTGFQIITRTIAPQFNTKFERKWCEAGQKEFYELFLIKENHINIALEEDEEEKVYYVEGFDAEKFECRNIVGEISVILKDFIFDNRHQKGMLHVIVAEPTITQHLWICIAKAKRGWRIGRAEGHTSLPTKGVAKAIQHVCAEAKRSSLDSIRREEFS